MPMWKSRLSAVGADYSIVFGCARHAGTNFAYRFASQASLGELNVKQPMQGARPFSFQSLGPHGEVLPLALTLTRANSLWQSVTGQTDSTDAHTGPYLTCHHPIRHFPTQTTQSVQQQHVGWRRYSNVDIPQRPFLQPVAAPVMNHGTSSSCGSECERRDLSSTERRQIERAACEIQQVYSSQMKPLGYDSLA